MRSGPFTTKIAASVSATVQPAMNTLTASVSFSAAASSYVTVRRSLRSKVLLLIV